MPESTAGALRFSAQPAADAPTMRVLATTTVRLARRVPATDLPTPSAGATCAFLAIVAPTRTAGWEAIARRRPPCRATRVARTAFARAWATTATRRKTNASTTATAKAWALRGACTIRLSAIGPVRSTRDRCDSVGGSAVGDGIGEGSVTLPSEETGTSITSMARLRPAVR